MASMNYSGEQITPFCPNRVLIGISKTIDFDGFLINLKLSDQMAMVWYDERFKRLNFLQEETLG